MIAKRAVNRCRGPGPARREWIALGLILLLAAGLRLTRLGLVEFKYDEATWARSALAVARGELPGLGMISSLGPYHPPLMSYLLAVPFSLSRDPRLASGVVALLGVVAVGLTYWVGRSTFGHRVGLLAALLFAACPWAVFHSRKTWTQNRPVLTLLFVAAVLALAVRRRRWALAGALGAAGLLVGIHLGGMAFFGVLFLVMLVNLRQVRPAPLILGLGLVLLILSPYLVHEVTHGWVNLKAFRALAQREPMVDLQALRMAGWITGGFHLEDLAGERFELFVRSIVDLRWLDRVEMVLFWIGLAWLVGRVGREAIHRRGHLSRDGMARLVLLFWFVVPVALQVRHFAPIHPHDLNTLHPVQHLMIALVLADGVAWAGRRWGPGVERGTLIGVTLLVLVLAGWQVYFQQSLLTFVATHETPGGYGAPVRYTLAATEEVKAWQTQTSASELLAVVPGADPRFDGQAAVFDVLLGPDVRLVDGQQAAVFPANPAVYLGTPGTEPAQEVMARTGLDRGTTLPVRAGSAASYHLFRWQPTEVAPPIPWDGDPIRWASGVTLLGYGWSGQAQPGGVFRWTLYWRVDGLPPAGTDLHWFNHLIDDQGARWGQMDGVGFAASSWRVGDTVATWFDIPISEEAPPPPYTVRVGMYTYPDLGGVSILDVAGNPAGEFVDLGPVGDTP